MVRLNLLIHHACTPKLFLPCLIWGNLVMTIKIYVGNLSFTTSETELNDLFAQFGEVGSTKIITDRHSGRSRGFAFVEMPNRNEGQSAINELNGSEVRGRNLKVSEARPKKNDRGYGGGRSYGSR
jgi:RNA recognition motif-containing protein